MATFEEAFKKSLAEQIPSQEANFRFTYEDSNKFLIWITGFDLTGIGLIIGNSDKITQIPHCAIKWVIVLLAISIILAILYKLLTPFVLQRWFLFELNQRIFTSLNMEVDADSDEMEEQRKEFFPKLKKMYVENLGISDTKFERDIIKKRPVFPFAIRISLLYYGSIIAIIMAILILVINY